MKTDHEHSFGRYLLLCPGTALCICAAVELACVSFGVAPLFTPNLPLNEKMRFIREHRPGPAPISVISGASVALNDIDSDLLEDEDEHPFINLGANGISVPSAEELYKEFAALYPVREVIFAADPLEMRDTYRTDVEVPPSVFRRYVLGRMTMAEEFKYRDISGLMSYWNNWRDYHSRSAPTSLVFSKTGAVPLEFGRDTADPKAWSGETIDPDLNCLHCVDDLARFCREVRAEGRAFTVVLGPIRPEVLARMPRVQAVDVDRRARIQTVLKGCGGSLFDITDYATLDDACFANSVHLNAFGMSAMTEKFVQFRRGETIARRMPLPCGASPVALGPSARQGRTASNQTRVIAAK